VALDLERRESLSNQRERPGQTPSSSGDAQDCVAAEPESFGEFRRAEPAELGLDAVLEAFGRKVAFFSLVFR
jgi:hypothetical protein